MSKFFDDHSKIKEIIIKYRNGFEFNETSAIELNSDQKGDRYILKEIALNKYIFPKFRKLTMKGVMNNYHSFKNMEICF